MKIITIVRKNCSADEKSMRQHSGRNVHRRGNVSYCCSILRFPSQSENVIYFLIKTAWILTFFCLFTRLKRVRDRLSNCVVNPPPRLITGSHSRSWSFLWGPNMGIINRYCCLHMSWNRPSDITSHTQFMWLCWFRLQPHDGPEKDLMGSRWERLKNTFISSAIVLQLEEDTRHCQYN